MTTIQKINTFALSLPLVILASYPVFKEEALIFALISAMITGFIQVIISFFLLAKNPKNKWYQFYILAVISFFVLWYYSTTIQNNNDHITYILLATPPILAIYISVIVYKKVNK